jgi:predicted O-methyltransferase YrrM
VTAGNPLEEYFRNNDGRLIHKWMHYFDIYHRHFEKFRGEPVVVVEFGVSQGGSLQMWRNYFGDRATIYGIDIDERCASLAGPGTHILIGDQEDRDFLRSVGERTGPIDVLIEDGGHKMGQQIATFEEMYPLVKEGGVFLIEDLHTSYWEEYGGGYRRPNTFMRRAKKLTDQLNAWHSRDSRFVVDEFTRTTRSMHFYDSIVVFEKGRVVKPHDEKTGTPVFDQWGTSVTEP